MVFERLMCVLSCTAALAMTGAANASVVYSYASDQSSYTVGANQPVTVRIYLQEKLTGSTSVISAKSGLLAAGVSVARETGVASSPAVVTSFVFNTIDFAGPRSIDQALTASGVQFSENIKLPAVSGVLPGNTGAGVATSYPDRIYLGSVTITGGSIANQTTMFDLSPDNVGGIGGYTLTKSGLLDLDITSASPAYTGAEDAGLTSFTVTTAMTPELSGVSLAAIPLLAATLARPRRKGRRPLA